MRTIVCAFRDQEELARHLRAREREATPHQITFLGDFEARAGEALRLVLVVEDCDQRCSVRVTLGEAGRAASQRLWRYAGELDARDQVWMEMFVAKLRTLRHFAPAGAKLAS